MKEDKTRVFNMDCMKYMKDIPDKYFELAVVDPPYGINVNMNAGRKKGEKKRYVDKKWDNSIPDDVYFKELFRVSKMQIIWGGNYFTNYLTPSMGWLLWDKDVPDGVSFSDFELAWSSFNIAAKRVKIPYCGFVGLNGEKRLHPTQKPVKLYEWILINYAKEGDKILDTHLGSSSSRIAAYNLGFDFTGIELDKEYFDESVKRFENHKAQLTLF